MATILRFEPANAKPRRGHRASTDTATVIPFIGVRREILPTPVQTCGLPGIAGSRPPFPGLPPKQN